MNYSDFTVVIPTLNEGRNIGRLLDALTEGYPGINVIVADDGSSDGTQRIVKKYALKKVSLLAREKAVKGLTASVLDAARMVGTDYFIVMDGDMQHPPEKIAEVCRLLHSWDIVAAARKRVLVRWAAHRRIVSRVATGLARLRLRRNLSDPLSGFFGVRTGVFRDVVSKYGRRFEPEGYKVFFDFLKYIPKDTSLSEVFYDFGVRERDESKIRLRHIIIFLRSLLK